MESLEITAKSVREAIEIAVARLQVPEDRLEISILSEGSRGILGIGGESARILVSVRGAEAEPPSAERIKEVAQEVLQTILDGMHIPASVTVRKPAEAAGPDEEPVVLDITGENMGILIGRRGETLSCLQFLTNLIVGRRLQYWPRVIVDVEGYRLRREEYLSGLARRVADRVRTRRQPVTLDPMPAHERRVVHLALRNSPYVTTESIGEGDERRVVISPKA
ncbi:MAG: protein jag [Bacteroidetes bacterium]|nr:protein jag [Bacteroidota bacterium]MCL5026276.1 protein jag [Chloroflexota bacterium]